MQRNPLLISVCLAVALALATAAFGADSVASGEAAIRTAVSKSLPLLEKSARISMEKRRQCFTCHNQALPIMAVTMAQKHGMAIDEANLREQIKFTADFLAKNQAEYLVGKGQGGQALTAGFALWTLDNGGWKPDVTTAAVTGYLLSWQKELDHWKPQSHRPPSEESLFTISYVALRGLKSFGTPELRERMEHRFEQVRGWALKTPAKTTEDRVFRLALLQVTGAAATEVQQAVHDLQQTQRSDGGWAQLEKMESDAYATGTALVMSLQAGGVATTDPSYQRGLHWLLTHQLADGSWHVETRSEPIQTYYESGYPHVEDQFISITAAGWATTALALALP